MPLVLREITEEPQTPSGLQPVEVDEIPEEMKKKLPEIKIH